MAPPIIGAVAEETAVPVTIRSASTANALAPHQERQNSEVDIYAPADRYYGAQNDTHKPRRTATFSTNYSSGALRKGSMALPQTRRASVDEHSMQPKKFLINVDPTLAELLKAEDSDGNFQITIEDTGNKTFSLGTMTSDGHKTFQIRGTYMLSNLLQELHLAKDKGHRQIVLDERRINENPVNRLCRLIKDSFWPALTRRLDEGMIEIAGLDTKDWTNDPRPRIYIPRGAPAQFDYYTDVARRHPKMRLEVLWLPNKITPEVVKDMNKKPGLLALAMEISKDKDGKDVFKGVPFVVPGGRFNELYGWDSYMESLGLLTNGREDLAKGMVENFIFCIKHYGKILNANRSYYLCRSQPPFLTDMTLRVYDKIQRDIGARDFLKRAIMAAIKEYHSVWMSEPRYDPDTGLSRYHPDGLGVPPETESTHFLHILEPYYTKLNMSFEDYVEGYNNGTIKEPKLDEYFRHDRAVRESGHDTSYRLEGVAADLATIDLNSLLYKYEVDIGHTIRIHFSDKLELPEEYWWDGMKESDKIKTSSFFDKAQKKRRKAMNQYLWNEEKGMFFDYNVKTKRQQRYESATTFWAMWAGLASPKQADRLVKVALPKLEAEGGLLSGTEKSRGKIGIDRPNRQWDYPYGWAPQQMLAWTGLQRYKFDDHCERLAYKWLFMITKAFFDYNGVVVEKYDVTRPVDPHRVDAEYGNQGMDFKGVAKEGFGWVNASYVYGMNIIPIHMQRALGTITPYETYKRMTEHGYDYDHDDSSPPVLMEESILEEGDSQEIEDSIPQEKVENANADEKEDMPVIEEDAVEA